MARLVKIGVRFNQNIAEVSDVLLVDESELDGLPPDYREGLGHGRRTVAAASRCRIPTSCRSSRTPPTASAVRELAHLFHNRAADANTELLAEAVTLRERIAELFGRPWPATPWTRRWPATRRTWGPRSTTSSCRRSPRRRSTRSP